MSKPLKNIVIVGGGSAGWLSAAIIAAEHQVGAEQGLSVTLVESPDIATIGVGEGTWPSMAETLRRIGVSEAQFIAECDASFKQGSKFVGWSVGGNEYYYHPFSLPIAYGEINLATYWQQFYSGEISFTNAVCPQGQICDQLLSPKQITTPEYAFNVNYGYHLNAGKFSEFLRRHCVEKLNVIHIQDDVVGIESENNGDIKTLLLKTGKKLDGDLFIDCTGFASLLIGKHYQIPTISKRDVLFNDTALATPVPYISENSAIASCTTGTAQNNGWIWDIGLSSRRGVGYVFSSAHIDEHEAHKSLTSYLSKSLPPETVEALPIRKIQFSPGYRETFWHKNCVAIGLSAGFIEPLEATALVLIELSAQMVAQEMPGNRNAMDIVAKRFNARFSHHWARIIDFLKLHYVLTQRTDTDYWRDHTSDETIPDSLKELLLLWESRSPWIYDSIYRNEMFPSASFQYVLYGMRPDWRHKLVPRRSSMEETEHAKKLFNENALITRKMLGGLPSNRDIIEKIKMHGVKKV